MIRYCHILLILLCTSCAHNYVLAQDKRLHDVTSVSDDQLVPLLHRHRSASATSDDLYTINRGMLRAISRSQPNKFRTEMIFEGSRREFLFAEHRVRSQHYNLATSSGILHSGGKTLRTYRAIDLESGQKAVLTIDRDQLYMIVMTDRGNYEITPLRDTDYHKGIYASDISTPQWSCANDDIARPMTTTGGSRFGECLEVYVECDFTTYQDHGSSVSSTESWVITMMNAVIMLYEDLDIPLVVSEIFIWDTNDPYESESSLSGMRDAFKDEIQNDYNGRIAMLVSTRPIGGGLADGIGGVCGSYEDFPSPYAVTTSLTTSYSAFPAYSYNIYVLTHEIGHVLGAHHTHACMWNGNNTQIDDCGNVVAEDGDNTPEGLLCFDSENPILPTAGTIMSRCNDLETVGIDFNNPWHVQVAAELTSAYENADCQTGVVCATIPPANDICDGAIHIEGSETCLPEIYDNYLATASGNPASFGCGNVGSLIDVWFSVTVPSSGNITIETTDDGSLDNTVMQTYTGTCNDLQRIECSDDEGIGNHTLLNITGLTPGALVFMRIIDSGSDDEGTFGLCAYDASLPCHPDYDALIDIYNDANGPQWSDNTGWVDGAAGTDCDVCNWTGIVCNGYGRVKEINLVNNNLSGTLSSSIGDITTLEKINIWNHTLAGSIPDVFSQMSDLTYVDLSNGDFTGDIPDWSASTMLSILYLENNQLDGTLPSYIGDMDQLNIFWAKNNELTGCLPSSYSVLCDRQSIQLHDNEDLPSDGDFTLLCQLGLGADLDMDGFCSGTDIDDDCDDTRNNVYPGATEICDGLDNDCDGQTDEGFVMTNTWNGSSGQWSNGGNWSLGHAPLPCEDVVIGSGHAQLSSGTGYARSLSLIGSATVTIDGDLQVSGSDGLSVSTAIGTTMTNGGMISVYSLSNSTAVSIGGAWANNGDFIITHPNQERHLEILIGATWTASSSSTLHLLSD